MKSVTLFLLLFLPALIPSTTKVTFKPDDIVGFWMTTENMLKVQVYKAGNEYRGKIIWFEDAHYKAKMEECRDEMNPDPKLRDRKVLGLEVVTGLKYNVKDNNWQDGRIYDSNSGKTYDSEVNMHTTSTLTVTGYWMFTWLGEDMTFYRVAK